MHLRGARSGIDAKGRSQVGVGDDSYAGDADAQETNFIGEEKMAHIVIKIINSDVTIDGLTITSKFGKVGEEHIGI